MGVDDPAPAEPTTVDSVIARRIIPSTAETSAVKRAGRCFIVSPEVGLRALGRDAWRQRRCRADEAAHPSLGYRVVALRVPMGLSPISKPHLTCRGPQRLLKVALIPTVWFEDGPARKPGGVISG